MNSDHEHDALFHLEAGPYQHGELRVVGFRGRESISRPYRWDVTVDAPNEPAAAMETALLAQPACLDLSLPGVAGRLVHGVVAAMRREGASADGARVSLTLRLVPRLWLLSRNRLSRVFQDMTAVEIVRELLDEAGIAVEPRIQHPKARRVYCVQYQESTLAFIQRILAEEGVFYFFEHAPFRIGELAAARSAGALVHGALAERVVLADGPAGVRGIAAGEHVHGTPTALRSPSLLMHHGEGDLAAEHHVERFSRGRTVRAQAVVLRDYDFRSPSARIAASQTVVPVAPDGDDDDGFNDALRDSIEGAGRVSLIPMAPIAVDPVLATVFEHHGEHEDPDVNRQTAQSRLEQLRGRAETAEGESYCRRLAPGYRFTLDLHRDSELDGEYTLTEVIHHGRTEGARGGAPGPSYRNSFRAIPAWAAPRPRRPKRSHQQVIETARVVGPPGEEIYTDTHGRIKVRFHWDLDGPDDGRSSCWIRPSQAWSGNGWGTQFIPRVGMEVLVGFLGGDKDRPVVLGCVYNGENTPAFPLPGDKTRSGIRTQSSPGGAGHNELSFEDAAGEERMYLRAQRELVTEVARAQHTVVGVITGDNPEREGFLREEIATDHAHAVGRDDLSNVGRDLRIAVGNDHSLRVGGASRRSVRGDERVDVGGSSRRVVSGDANLSVRRSRVDEVGGSDARIVGKNSRMRVGGDAEALVRGDLRVTVGGGARLLIGASQEVSTSGPLTVATAATLALNASEGLRLTCGSSSIEITPEGIILDAETVVLNARAATTLIAPKTSVKLSGEGMSVQSEAAIALVSDDSVTLESGGAAVELTGSDDGMNLRASTLAASGRSALLELATNATLSGTKVELNPSAASFRSQSVQASPEERKTSWVEVELKDEDGSSVAGAAFLLEMSNGERLAGVLNRMGRARVPVVPGATKVCFVDYDAKAWA